MNMWKKITELDTMMICQIKFFKFPRRKGLRDAWFKALGNAMIQLHARQVYKERICSEHFAPESYANASYSSWKKRRREKINQGLRTDALPTLRLEKIPLRHELEHNYCIGESNNSSNSEPPVIDNINKSLSSPSVSTISLNTVKNPVCVLPMLDSRQLDKYNIVQPHNRPVTESEEVVPLAGRLKRLHKSNDKRSCSTVIESESKMSKRQKDSNGEAQSVRKVGRPRKPVNKLETEIKELREIVESLKEKARCHGEAARFHKHNGLRVRQDRDKAEAKLANIVIKLDEMKKKNQRLVSEIEELKLSKKKKRSKLISSIGNVQSKAEQQDIVHSTGERISSIIKQQNHTERSVDDYATAICLRSVSQAAYTYMCKQSKNPLPPLSSIKKWALVEFDVSEGFLTDVLTLMREKGKSLSTLDKIGVITFGEMNLLPEICYDAKLEQMIGPCGKVYIIMVRGLLSNWKQPIYYKFDQPITKPILLKAISLLHEVGYQVVAVTCDIANTAVWKELEITMKNHHIPHPKIENSPIYVFADVPNLLKLLRNSFFDDGLVESGSNEKFTGATLQNLVRHKDVLARLGGSHRLTQRVIDARNTLTEAVWPASRVWSRSVARAVELAGKTGLLDVTEYQKLSDLIQAVNEWFDVLNSKTRLGKHHGVDAYGVDVRSQDRILLLMTVFMQNMRVGGRETLMPFQEGIMISNSSLKGLHNFLKDRFPNDYEYLITRRLQQDIVENFISQIREMGGPERAHPSGYDFRNRLHLYILGKGPNSVFNTNSNLEEESNASCNFGESPNSLANCNTDQERRKNNFSYIPATPSRSSDSHSVLSAPRRANEYFSNPLLLNVTSHENFTRPNEFEELCGNSSVDEPTYQYEPDPHSLIILTGEMLAGIMNSSTDRPEDIEDAKDLR